LDNLIDLTLNMIAFRIADYNRIFKLWVKLPIFKDWKWDTNIQKTDLLSKQRRMCWKSWVGDLTGHQYSHYNVFLNRCPKIKVNKCAIFTL